MKGAPMMANTKSHGTNKNYQKSGMGQASGAPFLGKLAKGAGKLLKGAAKFGAFGPLGMVGSALMDRNKAKQGGAADPAMAAAPAPAAPAPAPAPAQPGAAPVDATQMEEPGMQGAAMGKHLMKGAPMYGKKKGAPKKTGRPRYKKEDKPTDPNKKYTGKRGKGLKVSDKVKNAKPGAPILDKLIPSASMRDKIKKVKRKASDAVTYGKAYTKELFANYPHGTRKYPGEAGERALRAKRRGVDKKSASAIEGRDRRPLKPATTPKNVATTKKGVMESVKKMKRKQAAKNYKK